MRLLASIIIALLLPSATALAAAFPDVPQSHPNAEAIYALQKKGIIKGNDDGTFNPNGELNRAEGLTLLMRAAGITPRNIYNGCFPDTNGQWYEATVCHAKHENIVGGNPDGNFDGGRIINTVEFLKILLNSLGYSLPDLSLQDQVGIDFKNVNVKSWYAKYLFRSVEFELIPNELIANNDFRPDGAMTRALAAEIIYRALAVPVKDRTSDDNRSNANTDENPEEDATTDGTNETESTSTNDTTTGNEESIPTGALVVDFPLHHSGVTGERGSAAFAFELEEPGTVAVKAANLTSEATGISCFLYLLGQSGFSSEFFIGYEEAGSCNITAALRAGQYQVEVRSRSEGAHFQLDAEPAEGDGNDGFIEAVQLRVGTPRSDMLLPHDYEDWYRFRIGEEESHRVKLSSGDDISCTIYPSEDVDLFGFSGPTCGETFDYQPGTYYISVKKSSGADKRQSYTIELR